LPTPRIPFALFFRKTPFVPGAEWPFFREAEKVTSVAALLPCIFVPYFPLAEFDFSLPS